MECVVCEMWKATTAVFIQSVEGAMSVCGECEELLDEMGEIIEAWSLD